MASKHDSRAYRRKGGRGFAHAARALDATLKQAASARGFAEHRILTCWPEIAGAELARLCRPAKIAWGRREEGAGAALVVETSAAAAPETTHLGPLLIERVNAALGWRAVTRLRVTQTGGASVVVEPPAPVPAPPSATERALDMDAERHIFAVNDPEFREKLSRLARNLAWRASQTREKTE